MKRSFSSWLGTFIVCFLLWMLLTWSTQVRELLLGVVVSAIVAWFTAKFFIHEKAFFLLNPVKWVHIVVYAVVLVVEVIKANISMAGVVLSSKCKNCESGIVCIPAGDDIKSEYALATVSNAITLTPGTITMDVAEDEDGKNYYYVHWLNVTEKDRTKAGDIIKGTLEKYAGRIWR